MTSELADTALSVLHGHLVFVTKYRRQGVQRAAPHADGRDHVGGVRGPQGSTRRVQRRGQPRALAGQLPPKVAISKLVNSLKGVSSRRLRQEFTNLIRHYWRAQRLWSGSYFAGSVGGAPLSILRQYIEQQNRPV